MVYCKIDNCIKRVARYGIEYKKPLACGIHREEHYVNVIDRRCFCKTNRPMYGYENDERAEYCILCKKNDMINIKTKKCPCKKRPYFGYENDVEPTCCNSCKKNGMIDIVHKLCQCGSGKRPTFAEKNSKTLICCSDCKRDNMISLYATLCACGKNASFGLEKQKATHCLSCKTDGMFDVKHKMCKTEHCETRVGNKAHRGYCAYCYANEFPNSPLVRNFKTKERLVVDFIKSIFKDYSWKFDKIIQDACSKRRPDIFLDLGYMIIIIEIDENQHRQYENICENKRVMEISKDTGHRPIVFIRFNPDKYKDKNNKNIPSCFSVTKTTGALKVTNDNKWNERLNKLKDTVQYWIDNKTEKTVEVVELFYDEI